MTAGIMTKLSIKLSWTLGETNPDYREDHDERFGSFSEVKSYLFSTLLPGLVPYLLPLEIEDTTPSSIERMLTLALEEIPDGDDTIGFIRWLYEKEQPRYGADSEELTRNELFLLIGEWNKRYDRDTGLWIRIEIKEV